MSKVDAISNKRTYVDNDFEKKSLSPSDKDLKKNKRMFDEALQYGLSNTPIKTAYLPDIGGAGLGNLLNGKGTGQAATQV